MPYPITPLLFGLVIAVPLVAAARRIGLSYPIVVLLVGLAIEFVPGVPVVQLDPNLILLIFLPPLLYWEAVTAPTDVMLANPGQIGMLAIGLVLATTIVVAVALHAVVPGMSWPIAFVLGAIVAPTDELASAPVLERFRMPRHLIAIIEGESLVNDALSLVLYAAAVTAAVTGVFSLRGSLIHIAIATGGAFLVGIVAARIAVEAWKRITDPQLQGVVSVLLPFLAYMPSQWLDLSGVIAVVTAGVYASRFTPTVITPQTRLQGIGFWNSFVFFSNSVLFLLVGMQLRPIATTVFHEYSWPVVLWYAFVVNATVLAVRFIWTMGTEYLPVVGGASEHPEPNWKHAFVVSWSGLRGSVSLAAALAIPISLGAGGAAFPFRDLIIVLTFSVILVTLVGGGITLPTVIRLLKITESRDEEGEDLKRAWDGAASAALKCIDQLEADGKIAPDHATMLRKKFERKRTLAQRRDDPAAVKAEERELDAERQVIGAERNALVQLREKGEIDNAVLRYVQAHLDLAEQRVMR
jgi:CPA1 family monovalent cation:H+ antiporter